jgi:hypothetical protein
MELTRKQSEKGLDGLQLHRLCPVLARRAANRRAGHHLGGPNEQEADVWEL